MSAYFVLVFIFASFSQLPRFNTDSQYYLRDWVDFLWYYFCCVSIKQLLYSINIFLVLLFYKSHDFRLWRKKIGLCALDTFIALYSSFVSLLMIIACINFIHIMTVITFYGAHFVAQMWRSTYKFHQVVYNMFELNVEMLFFLCVCKVKKKNNT